MNIYKVMSNVAMIELYKMNAYGIWDLITADEDEYREFRANHKLTKISSQDWPNDELETETIIFTEIL